MKTRQKIISMLLALTMLLTLLQTTAFAANCYYCGATGNQDCPDCPPGGTKPCQACGGDGERAEDSIDTCDTCGQLGALGYNCNTETPCTGEMRARYICGVDDRHGASALKNGDVYGDCTICPGVDENCTKFFNYFCTTNGASTQHVKIYTPSTPIPTTFLGDSIGPCTNYSPNNTIRCPGTIQREGHCTVCSDTGRVDCESCEGGVIDCTHCGGTGQVGDADTTPPTLSNGSVDARISHTLAQIDFTSDEEGEAYYLVKGSGDPAPAKEDVKEDGTKYEWGMFADDNYIDIVLTAGAKDVYIVGEDAAGNLSEPLKVEVDALAAAEVLSIGGVSIVSGDWYADDYSGTMSVPYRAYINVPNSVSAISASNIAVSPGAAIVIVASALPLPPGRPDLDTIPLTADVEQSVFIAVQNGQTEVWYHVKVTRQSAGGGHSHAWETSWTSDGTGHWYACTGCTEKNSFAAHTPGDWIVDTPATATTDGAKHKECTVCEYVISTEVVPATGGGHTHSFGTGWVKDESGHWHACACGEKSGFASHTPGDWIIDEEATKTEDGSMHKQCGVCGYATEEEVIPATNIFFKLWGKVTTWEKNSFWNWVLCIVCFGWIWMAWV